MDAKRTITVGRLTEALRVFPADDELIFGDKELTFYRLKKRGESLVQLEFNERIVEVR